MDGKSRLVGAAVAGALALGLGWGTYAQEQNAQSNVSPNSVSPQTNQGGSLSPTNQGGSAGQDKINTPADNSAVGSPSGNNTVKSSGGKQSTTHVKGKHKGRKAGHGKHASRKGKGSRKHKTTNASTTKPKASAAGGNEISDKLRVIDASK